MRPYQYPLNDSSITIDKFGGINRKKSIGAGEFESAINLCSDEYPCLMPRRSYDRFLFNKYALQWKNNNMYYALYPAIPYEEYDKTLKFATEEDYEEWRDTETNLGYYRVLIADQAYEVHLQASTVEKSPLKSYILAQGFASVDLPDMPYFKNPVCTNISQQTVICDEINGMLVVDYDGDTGQISCTKVSDSYVVKNKTNEGQTNEDRIQITGGDFSHLRILYTDGTEIAEITPLICSEAEINDKFSDPSPIAENDLVAYGDSASSIGTVYFRKQNGMPVRVDEIMYRYWYVGAQKFKAGDYLYFSNHHAFEEDKRNGGANKNQFTAFDGWHEVSKVDQTLKDGVPIAAHLTIIEPPKAYSLMRLFGVVKKWNPKQRENDNINGLGIYWADGFTIERKAPEKANLLCTSNNRVWCNNGPNEIMCCAQGNPYVWYKYEGTALDSYAVTVGGDGSFTGCIEYGFPMFFKNDEVFRVTGTRPSNYQVDKYSMRGVKNGCHNSLAIVNDALYYQSKDGVYRYAGSTPVCISDKIYRGAWEKGYACRYRDKYYICVYERISDDKGEQKLYSFDTMTGIWHEESFASGNVIALLPGNFRIREEEALTIVTDYTNAENDISTVLIEDNSGWILDTATEDVEERKFRYYGAYTLSTYPYARYSEEDAVEWECTTGDLLHAYNEHKYLKRVFVSAELDKGSSLSVYVEYDRCGRWEKMSTVTAERLNTYRLYTANLNRCESFKIKLKGKGNATIHSINTEFEIGSDYE